LGQHLVYPDTLPSAPMPARRWPISLAWAGWPPPPGHNCPGPPPLR